MSQLTVLNGSGAIARQVVSAHLSKNVGKYASVKLVDSRPNRQSVYNWQRTLQGVKLQKSLARSVQSIDIALEGAGDVLYFTHDYYTMCSDKNSHLQAAAKLTKKHGVKNFVAVCPIEQDYAWSEDSQTYVEKTAEAESAALQSNSDMTLLKTNLVFGAESHLVHYLAQCALVGKAPYSNLIDKKNSFTYAPIFTGDVGDAVGSALQGSKGWYSLNGTQKLNLREVMDTLELAAGKDTGSTSGPLIPRLDYLWDFMYGTAGDLNMSRIVEFYENNSHLNLEIKPWTSTSPSVEFTDYYKSQQIVEEDYAQPTLPSYKLQHTD